MINDRSLRNRPNWQDYFLGLALLVAERSHDAETHHGCIITNKENKIVGVGYNGFPRSINDEYLPKTRASGKYPWMIHAEENALINCVLKPKNCTVYITGESCFNCLLRLYQNGIRNVVQIDRHGSHAIDDKERKRKNVFLEIIGNSMKVITVKPNLGWMKNVISI